MRTFFFFQWWSDTRDVFGNLGCCLGYLFSLYICIYMVVVIVVVLLCSVCLLEQFFLFYFNGNKMNGKK